MSDQFEELTGRLACPQGVLNRSDLRALGWSPRGVDAIMRALPTVVVPGFSRPHVLVADYLEHIAACTYRDGERVRP